MPTSIQRKIDSSITFTCVGTHDTNFGLQTDGHPDMLGATEKQD